MNFGPPKGTVQEAVSTYHLSLRGANSYVNFDQWGTAEELLGNMWSPENPDGLILLGVAENSMLHDDVSEYILTKISVDAPTHLTYGTGPRGSIRLRKALAAFLGSNFKSREEVKYSDIIVMPGVGSVVDGVTWALCNEGDVVLVPQPLYTGFDSDVRARNRAVLLPVGFRDIEGYKGLDDCFDPQMNRKALERAFEKAVEAGKSVRALILCSPGNPLGRCYSVDAMKEIASFCGKHSIHLISDEIYANSVFDNPVAPDAPPFTSILAIDLGDRIDPKLVHVTYGASKDFCANGLRLGMLYTKNEGLLGAVSSNALFGWSPYILQDIWASMLEDPEFLARFFAKNQKMMAENYTLATKFFEKHGIPYYKNINAAHYIWVDLRHFLFSASETAGESELPDVGGLRTDSKDADKYRQRESKLSAACIQNKVMIAAGTAYFTEELGWFRVTFTTPREALVIGLERLLEAITTAQAEGWD